MYFLGHTNDLRGMINISIGVETGIRAVDENAWIAWMEDCRPKRRDFAMTRHMRE
jgi:hypothetical protein